MRKIIWVVVGCAVLIGAVLLIGRRVNHETHEVHEKVERATAEDAEYAEVKESFLNIDGQTGKSAPQVSDAVLALIDPETGYQARLGAMRKLGYEVSEQDIAALKDFLVAGIPANVKISRGAYNSIRNDTYEVLLRQKEMPGGMGELLTDVVNDPDQDGMWRNYCIQFMEPFYERATTERGTTEYTEDTETGEGLTTKDTKYTKEGDFANSVASGAAGGAAESDGDVASTKEQAELQAVQESLWNALDERENSNAATALLGLERLSRSHPEFDRKQIDAAMVDLASDSEASVANRITAIRMCGEQGNVQALETARNLARNGDTTMLRCAAIATLGELGTEADLALLETCAASADERIQRVARRSLDKRSAD